LLDGVTITGNTASFDGGGLWADGFEMDLTIRNTIISGNTAEGNGGGIYVEDTGGPLLIQSSVISGNTADGIGGGIYFYDPDDTVTIEDSTISGNTAVGGGGVFLYDTDGGGVTIRRTTIDGNSAALGGGLLMFHPDHPVLLENSTISGNQALGGGGLFLYGLYGNASLTLRSTTVAGNTAYYGGGLLTLTTVTIENSIVGDNVAQESPDLGTAEGGAVDLAFSLVETPGTANINDNGGNIFDQDPQLGPLQNNGGPTATHLPAATSPAVDAGDPAFAPPPVTDQRGLPRVAGGRIDMGSVETEEPVVINAGTIQLAVTAASINENGGTITITATRTGGSDGAVSVSYTTSDGTAVAPGDYTGAAGTLNWADGDAAPKTFQVTIINDTTDEPDETFNVTLSNPQGGATLGADTTEVVTILDDDVQSNVVEIPTVGDYGRMLLVGLCALSGFLMLRRRKGFAAPMLAVSLALGAAGFEGAPASQPEVLEVRQGANGEIKKVRIEVVDTPAQARTLAGQE
ncbi:MAG TPA: choice-of-anchor Q domain-containing protein, partial [Thermoanaerobaculia bacterium]|nr:choice-of-anchor Q domain-containing protein [Thermoanaerobaculia bacterium]